MSVRIKDIADFMNQKAPNNLAYSWDNVGLMVGDMNQEVNKILLTLDLTPSIMDLAIEKEIDLVITHHPFIFHPLKRINDPNILKLIKNSIAVYSAHTNLDLVKNGVNYALAERLELTNLSFIQNAIDKEYHHVAVYIPENALEKVKQAVFLSGGGNIGEYSQCSNEYPVKGQFLPSIMANPTIGTVEKTEYVNEIKLEFYVDSINLSQVISAMLQAHPYETPAYSVYTLNQNSLNYGLGLFGDLTKEMSLEAFAQFVKEKLKAPFVKLWPGSKSYDSKVKKIAICGGSGSSIMSLARQADVFVTGDLNYHTILDSRLPLIDAGHFYTEYPVLQKLKDMLSVFELDMEIITADIHDINKLKIV